MREVLLAVVDPDDPPNRRRCLHSLLDYMGCDSDIFELTLDTGQKPRLTLPSTAIGYSLSHARRANGQITVMAVTGQHDIGLDVEHWPKRQADADFLATVACPEDEAALAYLALGGHDAGVALWVIKEAALKCTSDVMFNPRHLYAELCAEDTFLLRPSLISRAPHAEIQVRLAQLSRTTEPQIKFLLGIGISTLFGIEPMQIKFPNPKIDDWSLQGIGIKRQK